MYGDQPLNFTLVAAVAVSQYHIVLGSGENYGGLASAADQKLLGVCQNAPNAAEFMTIATLGKTRVAVGSAVAAYDRITSTASGRACTAASGNVVIGYALQAGSPGDIITAMLQPPVVLN